MKKLKQLLDGLDKKEKSNLKKRYVKENGGAERKKQLLEILTSSTPFVEREVIQRIYGQTATSIGNFKTLKMRLKRDLIELLNSKPRTSLDFHNQLMRDNRHLIDNATLFMDGNQSRVIAQSMLRNTEVCAKENKFYLNQIIANRLRVEHLYYLESPMQKRQTFQKAHKLAMQLDEAKIFHYSAKHLFLQNKVLDSQMEELEEFMETVRKHYYNTGEEQIGYHYHLGAKLVHDLKKEYQACIYHTDQLCRLISEHDFLKSPVNSAEVSVHRAAALLQNNRTDEARIVLIEFYKKNIIDVIKNDPVSLEYLFLSSFNLNFLTEVERIILLVKKNKSLFENTLITTRWGYFEACFFFVSENYNKSLLIIQKYSRYKRNIGILKYHVLILEYMAIVQNNKLDTLAINSDSFQKKIYRYIKNDYIESVRIKYILTMVRDFICKDPYFKSDLTDQKNNIQVLQKGKNDMGWSPMSYELIRFDEWLSKIIMY